VSRQEADDRRMAENLEAALHEDEPMSFGELNRSESSTEGDDEDEESERKGKGKAKEIPIKGRVKAGGGGITRVIWSLPEIEDKWHKAGKPQEPLTIKVKGGQQLPKGTGVYYDRPCQTCARRNFRCEKTDAGQLPCVMCKRMKVKCSHVGNRQRRCVVKMRPIISDSDFNPLATAEASAGKHLVAAKISDSEFEPVVTAEAPAHKRSTAVAKAKATRRVRKPVVVVLESSSEEEVVLKKAPTQRRIPRDAEEVLGVVQGISIFHT